MMRGWLIALGCAVAGPTHADTQLWLEGGVAMRATKRVELEVTPQVRFDQDLSRFASFLPEASVRVLATPWLRFGSGYRFEYERNNDGVLVRRHRLAADARLRLERDPVRVDYRLMLTEQIRPSSRDEYRTFLRNRLDVSYRDWKRWRPWLGAELFHFLGDVDQLEYAKLRLTAGVVRARKAYDVEGFFRIELHADPQDPTYYIFGLDYHYEL